nr:hypothetical protein CFP56_66519 [Quercus suber]
MRHGMTLVFVYTTDIDETRISLLHKCQRRSSDHTLTSGSREATSSLRLRITLQTEAVQDQPFRERRSSLPGGHRRFSSPAPDIPHCGLSSELDQGRGADGEEKNDAVAHHSNDQQNRPVRTIDGSEADGEPATKAPENESVAQVDGHDVRVQDDEELAREEPLHPRTKLDDHLERDRKY